MMFLLIFFFFQQPTQSKDQPTNFQNIILNNDDKCPVGTYDSQLHRCRIDIKLYDVEGLLCSTTEKGKDKYSSVVCHYEPRIKSTVKK